MDSRILFFCLLLKLLPCYNAHITDIRNFRELSEAYNGCGFFKTCIKICQVVGPGRIGSGCSECIKNRDCAGLVTIRFERGEFHSQMLIHQVSAQNDFVAMGLATEQTMLNAPFVACVYRPKESEKKKMVLFSGYTSQDYTTVFYFSTTDASKHIFRPTRLREIQLKAQLRPALLCEFTWKPKFEVKEFPEYNNYDLLTEPYYIIAATGNAGDPNIGAEWVLGGHAHTNNGRVISGQKTLLGKVKHDELDYDEDYDCNNPDCGTGPSLRPSSGEMLGLVILGALAVRFGGYFLNT